MKPIFLEGVIDEDGRLILDMPVPLEPGRVRVAVDTSEDEEDVWRALVAHTWADSLNNPAEDIYTENDRLPIDPATGEVIDETR